MLKPDQQLAVTLTAAEWNAVMTELGRARFNRVAPLILNIQRQCASQDTEGGLPMTTMASAPVTRLHPVSEDVSA